MTALLRQRSVSEDTSPWKKIFTVCTVRIVTTIPKIVGGQGTFALELAVAFYRSFIKTVVPVSSPSTAEAVMTSAITTGSRTEAENCQRASVMGWCCIEIPSAPVPRKPYSSGNCRFVTKNRRLNTDLSGVFLEQHFAVLGEIGQ